MDECRLVRFNTPLLIYYLLPWFGHILESNNVFTLWNYIALIAEFFASVVKLKFAGYLLL